MNITNGSIIIEDDLVPMYFDPVKSAIHLICAAFGIPLNVFVGSVLICNPSLYSARNTIWIGVIVSNLITLAMGLIEVLAIAGSNEEACLIFTAMMGKPYTMVLANLLLATWDRYVYTKWPLWHETHVTVCKVLIVEVTLTILIPFSLTAPYWVLGLPLRCGYDLRGNNSALAAMLVLNILCIISKSVVYCQSRKQTSGAQQNNGVTSREIPAIRRTWNSAESVGIVAHSDTQNVRQRELEATASLVAGLLPLCIFTLPNIFWVLWHLSGSVTEVWPQFESITVNTTLYFRDLILFHVCTNLIVYVSYSKEFRTAVRENFNNLRRRSIY